MALVSKKILQSLSHPGVILGITMVSLGFFWWDGMGSSRTMHTQIKRNLVEHPEFIPSATTVKASSSGFDALVGDFYWLSAIQYIGSNAVSAEYKKFLGVMLDLITDVVPHFTKPYEIGLLLLPEDNERYEKKNEGSHQNEIEAAVRLGKKGIINECDATKVAAITKEENLLNVWTKEEYKNPCTNPFIPYYLAYVSYWSQSNAIDASLYYKIASANTDAPRGARIMSALMQGKGGNREKAIMMFLSLAESTEGPKSESCRTFASDLRWVLIEGYKTGRGPTGEFVKRVEDIRTSIIGKLEEGNVSIEDNPTKFDDFCSTALNKAVRELNLDYIARADEAYFQKTGEHAKSAKALFEKKAIDYLPVDFQKEKGTDNSIIYYYNTKRKTWDFTIGNYDRYIYPEED